MWITEWTNRAACKGMDPDELFVRGGAQNRAKLICRGCPVRTECLADALDNGIEFGVWGGMTERERRALLRQRPDVTSWRNELGLAERNYDEVGSNEQAAITAPKPTDAEFEACYRNEFLPLVKFLMRLGLSDHDAADAAQSAFLEAYRCWQQIRNPRAWLRRVAPRFHKRLPERPVEDVAIGDQPRLSDSLEIREQTRRVMAALRRLPPHQREVMAWTYDGFNPTEIAQELGYEPAAVRKNLQRARENLKRLLRWELEEGK
jgi:RNA polymerase sigma factor (sigma-70 family)